MAQPAFRPPPAPPPPEPVSRTKLMRRAVMATNTKIDGARAADAMLFARILHRPDEQRRAGLRLEQHDKPADKPTPKSNPLLGFENEKDETFYGYKGEQNGQQVLVDARGGALHG